MTWTRVSHGLFDYESKQLQKKTLEANKNCEIIRHEHDVTLTEDVENLELQTESENPITHIARISYNPDGVHITNETDEGMWIIVKSNENMYKLSPNDVVKFGRVEYTVREIRTGEIGEVETDTEFEIEDIPEEREEEPR